MNVRNYRLNSEKTKSLTADSVKSAWTSVQTAWELDQFDSIESLDFTEAHYHKPLEKNDNFRCYRWQSDDQHWVEIRCPTSELKQLQKRLLKTPDLDESLSLLQIHLVERIIKDFIKSVFNTFSDVESGFNPAASPIKHDLKKGDGHLYSKVGLCQNMEMLISGSLLTAKNQMEMPTLNIAQQHVDDLLLGSENVKLKVKIDTMAVSLDTFNNLTVGDTLITETKIQEPVKVSINDKTVAAGYLCQQAGQKSIQIIKNER